MKRWFETLGEVEVTACVVASAAAALFLMLGAILWNLITREASVTRPQGSRTL